MTDLPKIAVEAHGYPGSRERVAARGALVGVPLRGFRSAHGVQRIAIEKLDGTLVAERFAPKDSFAGHQISTQWDVLHRAYFNGYALWTYLTTPFLLAMDGVRVERPSPGRRARSCGA
jgi:hypothetical protein